MINEIDITVEEVVMNGTSVVGLTDTIPELNVFENSGFETSQLSTIPECQNYYKDIIYAIIAFRKIRLTEIWLEQKINEISQLTTKEQLDGVNCEYEFFDVF